MKWQLNPQVVARRLGAASVLVNLDSNAIYELNVTGARVIDLLASGVDDLALPHQLRAEFDDVGESVQSDVRRLLEDLRMAGLILPVHG
jgi:coenzyme PQQ synthesis protein D (PqqD)